MNESELKSVSAAREDWNSYTKAVDPYKFFFPLNLLMKSGAQFCVSS